MLKTFFSWLVPEIGRLVLKSLISETGLFCLVQNYTEYISSNEKVYLDRIASKAPICLVIDFIKSLMTTGGLDKCG